MEFTKVEVAVLEVAEKNVADQAIKQLSELQLAAIGGGGGDVIFG